MLSLSLALISAILLGFYDVVKKESLNDNAVLPTLFFATFSGAVIFSLCLACTWLFPSSMKSAHLYVPQVSLHAHLMFIIKTVIVFIAWITAYFAMKNLPLTITSPIRCSNPLWTLFGAILIFHEKMNLYQWGGLLLTILFYYLFSLSGKKEGISFRNNKWVMLMVISTVVGAVSSLYDKYLVMHYDRIAMQTWYTIYMVPLSGVVMMLFWYKDRNLRSFKWRWTIPMIGILLATADYVYFWSIDFPGSLIALISTLRRGSVIVAFAYGALVFKEKNIRLKALAVGGILAGIALIILGK
jgi:bacterial/archaeal transporter family protein